MTPSLLLVTLDTTRADHLEPYGANNVETPTLAELAANGIVFERAYASTPVTLPSHASIFTGLDPPRHGVRNNGIHYLEPEHVTLAEVLRDAGFTTGAFVSAAVLERRYGLDQGFTTYDDDLAAGRPKLPRMVAERPAEVTVAAARRWLDGQDGASPFFLWVHLFDPHAAYAPPAPFAERYRERPYDGEIAYVDAQLGHLLAHPRLAADQDVVVMVIADHGESLGEHGEASHAMLAYDATLHIPWIVRLPGGTGQALRLEHEVGQVDLLPTALDLLGLGAIDQLDGASQVPAMRSRGSQGTEPRPLFAETLVPFYTYGWAQLHSLRLAGWKLIQGASPELFHTTDDPGELTDLFAQERRRGSELARQLEERASRGDGEAAVQVDSEAVAKLRSLGYLPSRSQVRAVRPDPRDLIDVHRAVERAEGALFARQLDQAISELRTVLERDPENLAALSNLATAYGERGDIEQALTVAQRTLALDPEGAGTHLSLAQLLARAGRDEDALVAVEASLALDPRSLDARIEHVRAMYRVGRHEPAIELVKQLLEENPTHPRINVGYAELVEVPAGEVQSAESRLWRAVEREPYLVQAWLVLGRVVGERRPQEAAELYRRALGYQPEDGLLQTRLGVLLARVGKDAEALPLLQSAAKLVHKPEADLFSAWAAIELRRGRWPAAEVQARRAVEVDPGVAEGWNQLAIALEEQGQAEPALAAYDRALEVEPSYWQARFNLGLLLRKQARFDVAARAFHEVLAQSPDHANSHYELGVLYGGPLAEPTLARRHLEIWLEAQPDHPRAAAVRQALAELPAS